MIMIPQLQFLTRSKRAHHASQIIKNHSVSNEPYITHQKQPPVGEPSTFRTLRRLHHATPRDKYQYVLRTKPHARPSDSARNWRTTRAFTSSAPYTDSQLMNPC